MQHSSASARVSLFYCVCLKNLIILFLSGVSAAAQAFISAVSTIKCKNFCGSANHATWPVAGALIFGMLESNSDISLPLCASRK